MILKDRWEYDEICLSTDRRPVILSNSSTKKVKNSKIQIYLKLNSAAKENVPPELVPGRIPKKMNFSFLPDDKYVSKSHRDRNGSPSVLTARSELTSCTTRRDRANENENLPYFSIISQTKYFPLSSLSKVGFEAILFQKT